MRCMDPVTVVLDGKRQFVPCGKCNFCLETRRAHWTFRLQMEMKISSSAHFLTLTYADENLPLSDRGLPTIEKRSLQLFTKRLRKLQDDTPIRYYSVGEYGTRTGRPHYHSLMFNLQEKTVDRVHEIWSLGNVLIGTVTPASIHYVTKYHVNKIGDFEGRAPPIRSHVS